MTDNDGELGGELFRYRRGSEVRIYRLRVVEGGIELWRITLCPGQPDGSVQEDEYWSSEAAAQGFDEVERTIIAGGWRRVDPD
jgi:hypothetical protein